MDNKYSYNIETSKDGYSILKIKSNEKNFYSSSKYNTKREIDKVIYKIKDDKETECFFIFGLSNGEYIEDLLKCGYMGKIVIVGYFEELVNKYKKAYGNKENLEIITFKEMKNIFLGLGKIDCIIYGNYENIFYSEILEASKYIKEGRVNDLIRENTVRHNSKIWIENTINNLPYLADSNFINSYKEVYKNKPAIIVSAGPSLEKSLNFLKGVEDNFIIISGGRTLPTLKKNDIKVDFTCVIDGGEASYNVIKDGLDYKTVLVFNALINKRILEEFKGEKVSFSTLEYDVFLKKVLKYIPDYLYGGGSVAHTSVDFARYMGCNPIIMIGQDLAYTNNKLHADGASIEEKNLINENCIDTMVENVYGDMIPTSYSLMGFKKNFEEYIEFINKNNNIKFINCSDGGAKILGTSFERISDVIKKYDKKIDKQINVSKKESIDKGSLCDSLRDIISEGEKVINLCQKAVRYNEELKKVYNKNFNRTNCILKELDKIDERIQKKKVVLGMVWTILEGVSKEVVLEYNKKNLNKEKSSLDFVVDKGILVNTAIEESLKDTISIIKVALRSIESML